MTEVAGEQTTRREHIDIEVFGLGCRCPLLLGGSRAEELAGHVRSVWARCLAPVTGARAAEPIAVALVEPGEVAGGTDLQDSDPAALLQELTQTITRRLIAAQTGRLVMLHAGSVCDPATGLAVAYAARGGTGKTTLSARLGRTLGYLTDETVGFDPDTGAIDPYPKPLSVRLAGSSGPKVETSPDQLGLAPTPAAATLGRLVVLDRRPEHASPSIEELDVITALTLLAPESSALSELDRPLQRFATLLDALPPVVRLTYTEAADVEDIMTGLLRGGS